MKSERALLTSRARSTRGRGVMFSADLQTGNWSDISPIDPCLSFVSTQSRWDSAARVQEMVETNALERNTAEAETCCNRNIDASQCWPCAPRPTRHAPGRADCGQHSDCTRDENIRLATHYRIFATRRAAVSSQQLRLATCILELAHEPISHILRASERLQPAIAG